MAAPEEMLRMVTDRSLEKEMFGIINHFDNQDKWEIISAIVAAFPGTSEDEGEFLIIKLALVASLGSGDEEFIEMGIEFLESLEMIELMIDDYMIDEDIKAFVESSYWKDCVAFSRLFDANAFLKERFPGYY